MMQFLNRLFGSQPPPVSQPQPQLEDRTLLHVAAWLAVSHIRVTMTVALDNGLVITGRACSAQDYFTVTGQQIAAAVPLLKADEQTVLAKKIERIPFGKGSEDLSDAEANAEWPRLELKYLHIVEGTVLSSFGAAVGSQAGQNWRIRMKDVSAFSFGMTGPSASVTPLPAGPVAPSDADVN
ncbi:hypothetical protein [Myxococcus sp. CA040A]|uniref:hypothetical protein n=1 Tax=Myxococcus sp. CA040A TaxID=2741738 RepID=UPI00157B6047|nr:hypothetical protein [Myxococcus sp. CA040A]NTX09029.1 hypothetical protein [Myxococcus sp. CA040A]